MATNIAAESKLDLVIVQGATFNKKFSYQDSTKTPIDLTGYTARLHICDEVDSASTLLELTTENGRITLNTPSTGDINLLIAASDTAALTFTTGVYDLELSHTSGVEIVDNILYGNVSVRKNVTR